MSNCLVLDGTWELAGFAVGGGDWSWPEDGYPIPAQVPGEVHPALLAAGRIPDPFDATNADRVRWVEERDWWYRRRFRVPRGFLKSETYLEFDGLDTFATVLLNGKVLGRSQNMFVPQRFEVTSLLREGRVNTLEVRFASAARTAARRNPRGLQARYSHDRLTVRKMQASFGWDWLPRLVGAGIWRSARLASYDRLSLGDVHVQPVIDGERAEVRLEITVANHTTGAMDAAVAIEISRAETVYRQNVPATVSAGGTVLRVTVPIEEPELWWPNGMGAQALYGLSVSLLAGGDRVDSRIARFGLRTIELRERDEEGQPTFHFVVNGVPFFAKGPNWIPSDAFPSRVSPARYRELLSLARHAHFNMLRVWGGGIYENPAFYNLCDEMGILVWQDFMFSLAEYPDDPDFVAGVAQEAHVVVRALRNHPCIALWCGNNECELDIQAGAAWSGKQLFHEVIPRIVRELDPTRPYWPTSPYGGASAFSGDSGDYHGEPWFHTAHCGAEVWRQCIRNDHGLFMSEFPIQGSPEVESLRRFLPSGELFPPEGRAWELHASNNQHRQGKIGMTSLDALKRNVRQMIGEPRSAEEFARMSGVLHGEFLQAQVAYYRRRRLNVGGALLWMFDNPWPAVDFSIVDYYLRPKPAYYYAKRAFAPVLLAFEECEGQVEAWVVNDQLQPAEGILSIGRVAGGVLDGRMERVPVSIPANGARRVWCGPLPEDPATQWLIGMADVVGAVARATHFSALFRELLFPEVGSMTVEREYRDGRLLLAVASDTYARTVSLDGLPDLARPDDDYFDLFPGEVRRITVDNLSRAEAGRVRVRVGPRGGRLVREGPAAPARVPAGRGMARVGATP